MKRNIVPELLLFLTAFAEGHYSKDALINVVDLTYPVNFQGMVNYYSALQQQWKTCEQCGNLNFGTAIRLVDEATSTGAMYPSTIPSDYLFTKLVVVDVTDFIKSKVGAVLSLNIALQWMLLQQDPPDPTLLLFKFGWKKSDRRAFTNALMNDCECHNPGISTDFASYIVTNLTRVIGVATDAPSLESDESRRTNTSVSRILGKNGIYIIENVRMKKKLPPIGCMAITMPLRLEHMSHVPTRLMAVCPGRLQFAKQVALTLHDILIRNPDIEDYGIKKGNNSIA